MSNIDNSVNLPQCGGCRHILDQDYPREPSRTTGMFHSRAA